MSIEADRNASFDPHTRVEELEDDAELDVLVREESPAVSSTHALRAPAQETPSQPVAEAPKPQDVAVQAPPKGEPEAPARRSRRPFLVVALLAALGIGGYYGYHWWTEGRFLVSTDDAYVKADMSVIAAKVGGYVANVPIIDNQHVKTGELLTKIDDRDYTIAVDAARNKLATQEATIARLKEQTKAQTALIEQAKAQVASAQAGLVRANADFERAQALAQSSFGSKQTLDQARAARDQGQAGVASAQAAQLSAEANLAVMNAQIEEAVRVRAELQSSLDQANLNLSYTEVRAPFDGVVGNKAVQPGQYLQPGTRLLALVPLDTVYIEANYKETQLADIKPGQKVDLGVDAADGHEFQGVIESIAPASGSMFSLLPPENATGNFTKIVQRVPVRIRVSGEAVKAGVLRPGLSVVTYVHTKAEEQPQVAQNAASTGAQAAPAR
jgi:membrane fusion protein, multidrug efflux system